MEARIRLFFAVELSSEGGEAVRKVQALLRRTIGEEGIRWVPPEQFHYTLKFLGDTPETEMETVKTAGRAVAARTQPFAFTLAGLGVFPEKRKLQILWIGATEGVPLLNTLAESLDRELTQHGFAAETRRFNAHLTLARTNSPEGEEAVAKCFAAEAATITPYSGSNALDVTYFSRTASEGEGVSSEGRVARSAPSGGIHSAELGVLAVNDFVLMQSELRPSGPVYTVLERFPLITL